ncbi:MAG: phage tail tube protein [Oscillospiraceae bacterium]
MGKQTNVLHGSCSEVYINGVRDALATKIAVKVTGDFEDGTFCGEYGTFPIYNGYSIEGSISDKKENSSLETAIAEGYATGVMPDIVLITSLASRASKQSERWSISGVVFTEVALANCEAKKSVERELPFKAESYQNLEAIE